MKTRGVFLIIAAALVLAAMTGCTKRYVVTHGLDAPLPPRPNAVIGDIHDELPIDYPAEKKPTREDIDKFKNYLSEEMIKNEVFGSVVPFDTTGKLYEVTGGILDYKKGSGFLRFLFGAWAGGAKVTVRLVLKDRKTDGVVFSGNFTGNVSSWSEGGDKMFKTVASDFRKALEKQIKNLKKAGKG